MWVCMFFFRFGNFSTVFVWPEMGMINSFSYLRSMMIFLFRA